jgi:hypothetical protein
MRILDHDGETRPPQRRGLVPFLLGALFLAGAGGLGWWWLARPAPARQARATTPPSGTAPDEGEALGTLEVTAIPAGATVYLDGTALGPAPHREQGLSAGPHTVRLERSGYLPFERRLHIVPGVPARLEARLERVPSRFTVDADVPGASVFIDRQFVGKTPHVVTGLATGPHRLNVSVDGYSTYAATLEIGDHPDDVMVRFKEVHLDQSLDVIHKHGIGSCQGRLYATPEGLRYQPTSGSHAFAVPLRDLVRFEVDYLAKNLRVTVRGGKTYNFTDRSENADALLVFQREVDRVRSRE